MSHQRLFRSLIESYFASRSLAERERGHAAFRRDAVASPKGGGGPEARRGRRRELPAIARASAHPFHAHSH